MSSAHSRTKKRTHYAPWVMKMGQVLLRVQGWQWIGQHPGVKKCVVVCAPHRSNWDAWYTLLASFALGIPAVMMIKDTLFFWPLGVLLRWLDGMPVNRRARASAVDQVVQMFNESEQLYLVITPEGTRKEVTYWKSGFYWIALGAGVDILLGIINYQRKTVGVGPLIQVTGDIEADFARIQEFFQREGGFTPLLKPVDTEKESPAPNDSPPIAAE